MMLAEAAMSLAENDPGARGGVLTPASAIGPQLVEGVRRGGMTLKLVES